MRRLSLLLLTLGLSAGLAPHAAAITDGELDGTGHPYVGMMVARDADGLWRCSGTLLSSTVFLTAGHCTDGADHVELWFGPGPIDPPEDSTFPAAGADPCAGVVGFPCDGDVSGTAYTHPDFDPDDFIRADLGVVVLDEPVVLDAYGALPELDQLDALDPSGETTFTAVGYGVQKAHPKKSEKDEAARVRMVAHPRLLKINEGVVEDFAMLISSNSSTGGTCFADSGGPVLLGDSNVVAGVVSFAGNDTCGGHAGAYRVDRADDLTWLHAEFGDLL